MHMPGYSQTSFLSAIPYAALQTPYGNIEIINDHMVSQTCTYIGVPLFIRSYGK